MIARVVLGGALAAVLGAFAVAHTADRVRGVRSDYLAALDGLHDRLTTDDATWWVEVLGAVFAPALTVRSGCHVWMALLAGADPQVDPQDVTLQNVVVALRDGSVATDLAGRLLAAGVGVTGWLLVVPVIPASESIVRAYVALNCTVLTADPLGVAVRRCRSTTMRQPATETQSEVTE
jgi:hypothetical protein